MGQLPIMFFIPGRVAQKILACDPVPPALRAFRRLSLRSSLLQARRAGGVRLCAHTRPPLLAHCSPLLAHCSPLLAARHIKTRIGHFTQKMTGLQKQCVSNKFAYNFGRSRIKNSFRHGNRIKILLDQLQFFQSQFKICSQLSA